MKEKKFTLLTLAIPILIELALFIALGLIDTVFLSRVSDDAAGAVGAANQILNFFSVIFSIISTGAAVLITQFGGANKTEECHKTVILSYLMMVVIGAVCSIILFLFSENFLHMINMSEDMIPYADSYIKWVGSFIFIQALLNMSTVIMRSHGYAFTTLFITVSMNICNIIGNSLLIFGLLGLPKLGVAGAAIATTLSRLVAFIIAFIFVFKRIVPLSAFKYIRSLPLYILKKLMKVGLPSALETLSYNTSQIVITTLIFTYLGKIGATTKTYVSQIVYIGIIFSSAIGQASQIMTGRLVGQEDYDEAYKTCLKNLRISLILAVSLSTILYIFREQLLGIFTSDPEIIKWGVILMLVDIFLEPGRTFNVVLISGLRGAGDVIFPVVMAIIFMWGVAVFGSYIALSHGFGLPGLWIALAMDEWIRAIAMYFRWRSKKWTNKSLAK